MPPLTQNWMRDYDPTTGRYMQVDPLGLVDGASVYGYAGQSPRVNADPTGLCFNVHSNACKAVNKARFNATLARMGQGANAYAAASAGYAVGMAGADGCITADELGSAAVTVALDMAFGKLFGLASAGMKVIRGPGIRNGSKRGSAPTRVDPKEVAGISGVRPHQEGPVRGGTVPQYQADGGIDQAWRDFETAVGGRFKTLPNGNIRGTRPNRENVIFSAQSTGGHNPAKIGPPTIYVNGAEIRYD